MTCSTDWRNMAIRKRKNKSGIVYEVYISYTKDGIKRRYQKSGFKTKEKALDFEEKKIFELLEKSELKNESELILNAIWDEFLETNEQKYSKNTLYNTKKDKRYLNPNYDKYCNTDCVIGNMNIKDIDYRILQNFFNSRSCKGIETNKSIKKSLNRVYEYALKVGYVDKNPIQWINVSGVENKHDKTDISDYDLYILLDKLHNDNTHKSMCYYIAIQIALNSGLRREEVLALNKNDIDFENNIINVNKVLVTKGLKKKDYYTTTKMKSAKSKAILPLSKKLKTVLIDWFEMNSHDIVVCDKNGMYVNPDSMCNYLRKLSKKLGVHFTFHELRHTYGTRLVSSGLELAMVRELMRHDSINTTLKFYNHINLEKKKKAIDSVFG